jgi:DNA-binding PadR family transcriptional regulator
MSYSIIKIRGENMANKDLLDNMIMELKRGTQIMIVLDALKDMQYGYSLLQVLNEKKVNIEAGTLYPLLRRLDKQGLLDSIWDTTESRPRKYYKLNEQGTEILKDLTSAWLDMVKEVNQIIEENK